MCLLRLDLVVYVRAHSLSGQGKMSGASTSSAVEVAGAVEVVVVVVGRTEADVVVVEGFEVASSPIWFLTMASNSLARFCYVDSNISTIQFKHQHYPQHHQFQQQSLTYLMIVSYMKPHSRKRSIHLVWTNRALKWRFIITHLQTIRTNSLD